MDVGAQSVKCRVRRLSSFIVAYSLEPAGRDQVMMATVFR